MDAARSLSPALLEAVDRAIHALQARPLTDDPLDDASRDAIGTLYAAFAPMARGTAARILGETAEADDVLHDVFLQLPRIIQQYRHQGFRSWLYRVVVTRSLMLLRRRRRCTLQPSEVLHDMAWVGESTDGVEDSVDDALMSLPIPLREIAVLRFFAGYSHQRIAETLDITVTASEMRLFRAVSRMRQHFSASRCGGRRAPTERRLTRRAS